MSNLRLDQLPEIVLLCIIQHCRPKDLGSLSSTCSLFYRLTADELLWKHFCMRDFSISDVTGSYQKLYTNLLYKYGCMLGLYQSQVGPIGGLLEVRHHDGAIEGVSWEPSSEQDVCAPLKESLYFSVAGQRAGLPQCFPGPHTHTCTLSVDKWRGTITQRCSDNCKHSTDSSGMDYLHLNLNPKKVRLIFLNEVIGKGLEHKPLFIPSPSSIPASLLNKDSSVPRQIITPGLFQGFYHAHGLEIILFKFKDENEIIGYKVTGDVNVYASKITVKLLLKYPVAPSKAEQRSLETLKAMEPVRTDTHVNSIANQSFVVPDQCYKDTITPYPSKCLARYHGFGQIAAVWYQSSSFTPVQVVVFSNDLIGVVWLELASFSLFSRIKKKFTANMLKVSGGAL